MHQPRVEVEVVEAGLAFLGLHSKIFELPVVHRSRLGRALATGLVGLGLVATGLLLAAGSTLAGALGLFACFARRFLRFGRTLFLRGMGVGGCSGGGAGLGLFALAKYLLECFEHGGLVD
ncbi:hypothetical protein D9M68_878910 [compost metagenome]